jgi:flagellin
MERLSSGYRINRAGDDAAGLGISEKMRAQINGVAQATRNSQDGISMVQTAEGALQEFHAILHRIRDLAVQYNNGIYATADKAAITAEVAQLSAELTRMITVANFNGIALLTGDTVTSPIMATLQVGANNGEIITLPTVNAGVVLGTEIRDFADGTITVGSVVDIAALDLAIEGIASTRAIFGSVQNRLEHTVASLQVYQENLMAAESRIRDVDMAAEMTNFTRLQILQQSGTAMLAQANQASASVLSLLQ